MTRTRFVSISVLMALLLTCTALAKSPKSRPSGPIDRRQLEALVDSVVTAEMGREKLPGAGFVFVQNGKEVWKRAYGMALRRITKPTEMTAKTKSAKKPPMPAKWGSLPPAELDALVAYMSSLK